MSAQEGAAGLPGQAALAGTAAAAAARRARTEVKRQMEFSSESVRRVMAMCDGPDSAPIRRMSVVELLAAMPGVGPRRAEELAGLAGVAPGRRLGGLGHQQVEALCRLIDERAARRRPRGDL
jgi:guanylate kinase